jgi:hypothetical protein
MKSTLLIVSLAGAFAALAAGQEVPPRQEIGFTLGGLLSSTRGDTARLDLSSGVALQANYGYRILAGSQVAIYAEVHLLANPLRDIHSSDQSLTRNVATLFVTPGIRVKFLPLHRIAPYVAIGGGWADYEQSTTTLAGRPNPASRVVNHGAFDYGGGADIRLWRFVGLRAELRDFYTGAPAYNTSLIHGGQHTVVAGGGFVLKL